MNRSIVSMLLATFVLRVSTAVTGFMLINLVAELTRGQGHGALVNAALGGGFYATELSGAVVFGVLADRYGRKIIMLLGPACGAVAVFMTGLTTLLPVLWVTRLLEGASTAASVPSTLGFIAAETSHDERLRGRVVSLFELVSLGGMLAVGPWLGGQLWDAYGRPAFFINCGVYMVAFLLYAYGVSEVPRADRANIESHSARRELRSEIGRYLVMASNRRVLLFAPTWLAINAVLGMWALHGPFLLRGGIQDESQFLMRGLRASDIGTGEAAIALVFGLGLLVWGLVYARFRRTTMIAIGVAAFIVAGFDIFAINHLGGQEPALAICVAIAVVAVFVMSGATPAALGLLADVSEGFEADRSAIMGLYSVFMGLGNVIGIGVGGVAASAKGIDGLLAATAGMLLIGGVALLHLRSREFELLEDTPDVHEEESLPGPIQGTL